MRACSAGRSGAGRHNHKQGCCAGRRLQRAAAGRPTRLGVDDLALQVGRLHHVAVRDGERAHARGCEVQRGGRAQAASAHDQHARARQRALRARAEAGQRHVARVAAQLRRGQAVAARVDPTGGCGGLRRRRRRGRRGRSCWRRCGRGEPRGGAGERRERGAQRAVLGAQPRQLVRVAARRRRRERGLQHGAGVAQANDAERGGARAGCRGKRPCALCPRRSTRARADDRSAALKLPRALLGRAVAPVRHFRSAGFRAAAHASAAVW
jgi:hypothetical protein